MDVVADVAWIWLFYFRSSKTNQVKKKNFMLKISGSLNTDLKLLSSARRLQHYVFLFLQEKSNSAVNTGFGLPKEWREHNSLQILLSNNMLGKA